MENNQVAKPACQRRWHAIGIAGFVFFFVKGLLWLVAGLTLFEGCRRSG